MRAVEVAHPMVTRTFLVLVPAGAVTMMVVEVLDETTAVVPPNLTILSDCIGLKPEPVIVTVVPTGPEVGETDVTIGR